MGNCEFDPEFPIAKITETNKTLIPNDLNFYLSGMKYENVTLGDCYQSHDSLGVQHYNGFVYSTEDGSC